MVVEDTVCSNFNVWIKTVTYIKELLEFSWTKSPEEEDVINESEPHQ